MFKVTGTLQKSTEIMKLSNNLIRLPQMSQSMREMSSELMKVRTFKLTQAGILEEMMNDTLDSSVLGEDQQELEEEAQEEVDNVLRELTGGTRCTLTQENSARPNRRASFQASPNRRPPEPRKTRTWSKCKRNWTTC